MNPAAIGLLERNQDKICWVYLSLNPAAIGLLERNKDKIEWSALSLNPGIFVYDYAAMRSVNVALKEEIIRAAWHPRRVLAALESGMDVDDL
jgi:hypothetical protein